MEKMRRANEVTETERAEMVNLYHLARTALTGTADESKFARRQWATREFTKAHPDVSHKAAWLALEDALR